MNETIMYMFDSGYKMRLGPGELEKIIDDAIARKGREPLEFYKLLVEELERIKKYGEKIESERVIHGC